nr:hypothetical protein [Tanacetum cinerariifolium]
MSAEKAWATIEELARYEEEGWNDPVASREGSLDYENPDIEQLLGVMKCKVDILMKEAISLMGIRKLKEGIRIKQNRTKKIKKITSTQSICSRHRISIPSLILIPLILVSQPRAISLVMTLSSTLKANRNSLICHYGSSVVVVVVVIVGVSSLVSTISGYMAAFLQLVHLGRHGPSW